MDLFGQSDRDAAIDELFRATALFTAEQVVDEVLDSVQWPDVAGRLLDSSCGDGAFLARALERALRAQPDADADSLTARLEGWEIHPWGVAESRKRLSAILCAHGWREEVAQRCAQAIVNHGDFLTEGPRDRRASIHVGNPPYARAFRIPKLLLDEYRAVVPDYAMGDLLHSFLQRTVSTLAPGGRVGLVTADRWLFSEGCRRLRARIGEHVGIQSIRRLNAGSAFERPKIRRAGTPPRVHPVAIVFGSSADSPIRLSEAPIYPDATAAAGEGAPVLGDVAEVRLAPWLGPFGIFVVDEVTARRFPPECLVPAVDTDDIVDGKLGRPRRFALRTQPDREPHELVLKHLRENMHRMCARGRMPTPWIPPESFHRLRLDRPALLVPRIAKSLRPVHLPAGVLAVNHQLSVVASRSWELDAIEQVLKSESANEWMREHAARLENGYYSLTTRILRQLPLPSQS